MATLAHALQLVGWWIAPLIIFAVKRQSRFVAFHALQALLLQVFYMVMVGIFMAGWFIVIFSTIAQQTAGNNAPPKALFLFVPLLWLILMAAWVGMLTIAIVYAIKAGRGEWADYPVLGRLARKILKMEPAVRQSLPGSALS